MSSVKYAPRIHAVDLFCGVGGLTKGLELAGISVRAGFDIDTSCRYAYEANNSGAEFHSTDIRNLRSEDILPLYRDADYTALVGCAPCQPFSSHASKNQTNVSEEYSLVGEFIRLIRDCKPDFVSMENVRGLSKRPIFDVFLRELGTMEYEYDYDIVSCRDYGVPQNRKRLVLVASRLGKISLPRPTENRSTVGDFIRHLPQIADGTSYPDDPVHCTLPLSDLNMRRMKQSKPGGSWQDWDDDLINECHRKAYYPASYGRMRWNAEAPTITTQFCYYSTGRFGHPEQDRTISVREAALLQTFPERYEFLNEDDPISIREMARHIGNAVPVKLGAAIGETIVEGTHVR